MAAVLLPAPCPTLPHRIRMPQAAQGLGNALDEVRYAIGSGDHRGPVVLEANDWWIRVNELREVGRLLERAGLSLVRLASRNRHTLVAAAALGLESEWSPEPVGDAAAADAPTHGEGPRPAAGGDGLTIHRGTLRSGDHLQGEGSVLQLGDVNPGARISAGGHVLVWGRLRGIAHAGRDGDPEARIVALQLKPLQLRIADAVARGPEDSPPEGLAEEARLVEGAIRIDPAAPTWPLSG